jgi:hypothetical protein
MTRRSLFIAAAALACALIALAGVMHWRAENDIAVRAVPLDPADPSKARLGALIYRGGLDIPRMGQGIGGLSALRWDEASGRLLALSDDARWVWITPLERGERLVGLGGLEAGPLLSLAGEELSGKQAGDSEGLTQSAKGGWLVIFERDHRIWRYPGLDAPGEPTGIDPVAIMGALEANGGTEVIAVDERALFLCAEREALPDRPNCFWQTPGMGPSALGVEAPRDMRDVGAVPTDADMASDARLFVLFRSYNPSRGNVVGITVLRPDGSQAGIATLRAPLSVDNFEGLAVREEGGKTFLYIVSDDNFSSRQRTLLMKFELAPTEP